MRAVGLLFLTMSWAAWMQGTGNAVPPSPTSRPTSPASAANATSGHSGEAGHAVSRLDGRTSATSHPPTRANLARVNRPKAPANSRPRPMPGNGLNAHLSGTGKLVGAPKGGIIANKAVNNASPGRTPGALQLGVPSSNNMRHRDPNPAVLGESPSSHRSNTGVINGTSVKRKW